MLESWLIVALVVSFLTAGIMAVGLRKQRRGEGRVWPLVAVGLLVGLLPAIAVLAATWASRVWPERRRFFDGVTVVGAAALAFVAVAAALGPSLQIGPTIGEGRIERPEHGFALTLPAGWKAQEATPEGVRALLGEDEELPAGQSVVMAAERSFRRGYCFVTFDDPSEWDEPGLLAGYADATETAWRDDPEAAEVRRERVDLPAGPAWRLDATWGDVSESAYILRGQAGLYALEFVADDAPADRWLSIARTFEFLPDPTTGTVPACPVHSGGRIERPEHGFALTFPGDWVVEEVPPGFDALAYPDLDPVARAQRRTLLWADQADADGYCVIEDITVYAQAPPAWTSVRAATRETWNAWQQDPGVSEARWVIVDLPAGRAGHISGTGTDGMSGDAYILTDLSSWVQMKCWSSDPPADRWRSIAESLEFVPRSVPEGVVATSDG